MRTSTDTYTFSKEETQMTTKTTPEERRLAITTSMLTNRLNNAELAEELHVTERTITRDRAALRKQIAETIRAEDVGLVLADIHLAFNRNMKQIEESKS